jgi:hypothetical protein
MWGGPTVVLVQIGPENTAGLLILDAIEQERRIGEWEVVLQHVSRIIFPVNIVSSHAVHVDKLREIACEECDILDI